ncbi:hypothetical protein A3A03_03900 [Candidatus Nomurabacteria bacterium RIFCSPLOWO2_01_FULL_40_18]|uniref:Uncharacterized protein n=1 Tax=Candidatus Nomurabacteria bacterium RIFCSPLOWO2_01_FULL_40_18 TaxID=1801773 RepID=A0A1F6XK37_9BACT|nr:MAG: hypothetical protein A3A03_03900 [Candidatus Nomurabacteria bacterium RIFCSPLOWO2_01_FULL_40_18]
MIFQATYGIIPINKLVRDAVPAGPVSHRKQKPTSLFMKKFIVVIGYLNEALDVECARALNKLGTHDVRMFVIEAALRFAEEHVNGIDAFVTPLDTHSTISGIGMIPPEQCRNGLEMGKAIWSYLAPKFPCSHFFILTKPGEEGDVPKSPQVHVFGLNDSKEEFAKYVQGVLATSAYIKATPPPTPATVGQSYGGPPPAVILRIEPTPHPMFPGAPEECPKCGTVGVKNGNMRKCLNCGESF